MLENLQAELSLEKQAYLAAHKQEVARYGKDLASYIVALSPNTDHRLVIRSIAEMVALVHTLFESQAILETNLTALLKADMKRCKNEFFMGQKDATVPPKEC